MSIGTHSKGAARVLRRAAYVACVAATGLMSTAAFAYHDFDRVLLEMSGQFELGSGQTKLIASDKTDHDYRICVRSAKHGVPLKVVHDGASSLVKPGACENFQAARITIAPKGALDSDTVLLGRYERML